MSEDKPGAGKSQGRAGGGGRSILSFDLTETYVCLGTNGRATLVPLTDAFWEEVSATPSAGRDGNGPAARPALPHSLPNGDGWLISAYWLEADMATWERHPRGDRLVIAETGSFTLVLDHQNGARRRRLPLDAVGSVLVPCGCWHRLVVNTPGLVLFIGPLHGTEHRPV